MRMRGEDTATKVQYRTARRWDEEGGPPFYPVRVVNALSWGGWHCSHGLFLFFSRVFPSQTHLSPPSVLGVPRFSPAVPFPFPSLPSSPPFFQWYQTTNPTAQPGNPVVVRAKESKVKSKCKNPGPKIPK